MADRVQLSRRKGWRMPANTVNVARPSKWGNPFKVGPDRTAAEAVAQYRAMIEGFAEEPNVSLNLADLRGKNLACWCKLGEPCHADVLLELAND